MTQLLLSITVIAILIWLFLLVFWGQFWHCSERLEIQDTVLDLPKWPSVCAIVPARDEAPVIAQSIQSLLTQDYPGQFSIVLVDDQSTDGTGAIAHSVAQDLNLSDRLHPLTTCALPHGWSGKLWAVNTGIQHVLDTFSPPPQYLLLTDADIVHPSVSLKTLVHKAETEQQLMVSLMVQLRCQSFWEKLLIPAFIFFFQKLYPFPWVNNPQRKIAAAAGGCILVQKDALVQAGGIEVVRDALIDDCALAAAIKESAQTSRSNQATWGKIWLGLSKTTRSLRVYDTLESIWTMVARTAYTQLNYSPLLLMGSLVGMVLVYLWAPLGVVLGLILGQPYLIIASAGAWGLMAIAYLPTIWLYELSPLWVLTLPLVGLLYSLMTVDSALRHWRGQGGAWKGRVYPAK